MLLSRNDIDSQDALVEDKKLIKKKGILNKIYIDLYKYFKSTHYVNGPVIELGSGGGFIKEIMPKAITSDVIKGPGIDKVFFAEKMPYKNSSVAGYLMIDVLHHIKDPIKAFIEMERCLKVGGKIIMVEPYNSPIAGILYKYIHYEYFNPKAGWKVTGKGRMSDSNTALPWIIFVRDRKLFEKKFPKLKINKVTPHTPIRYILSGGLTKWQFLPTNYYPGIKFVESLLTIFNPLIGMFVTIELEKIN